MQVYKNFFFLSKYCSVFYYFCQCNRIIPDPSKKSTPVGNQIIEPNEEERLDHMVLCISKGVHHFLKVAHREEKIN